MTCGVVTYQMFDSHFLVIYCWPVSENGSGLSYKRCRDACMTCTVVTHVICLTVIFLLYHKHFSFFSKSFLWGQDLF